MKQLKDIAADMGVAYIFADWSRANLVLDGARLREEGLPVILDIMPAAGTIVARTGMLVTTSERMVWFLDATRMDSTSAEDATTVADMLALARQFIARVNACGYYRPVDATQWQAEWSMLDENVSGVCLTFNLVPLAGECVEL